jgi:hypothetical protein
MALDYFAIVSLGVYPEPTPTNPLRSALAVSAGLLNITLPGAIAVVSRLKKWLTIFSKRR